MPSIVLQPGSVPSDAALPSTVQEIVNTVAAYLLVSGLESLDGVIISATEPAAADRSKLWVKKDGTSSRVLGIYTYRGGWNALPAAIPSGDTEPDNPQTGELFYNSSAKVLKIYTNGTWTTNFRHEGTTSNRPTTPPVGYQYYDTDIQRLIHYTAQGWTTDDGFVGQIIMVADLSEDEAKTRNPGWSVYEGMNERFPIGRSTGIALGATGGRDTIAWSVKTSQAQGGSGEQGLLSSISIDGDSYDAPGANGAPDPHTYSADFDIKPPYKAVLWLRKMY